MRSNLNFLGFLVLSILTLFSCEEKGVYPLEKKSEVGDLIVPSGFDWKMIEDLSLVITSSVGTQVSIFFLEDRTPESLIADVFVSETDASPILLSVPKGTETIYIQYLKSDETTGVLPVLLSTATRNTLNVKLPEGTGESADKGKVFYYPSMNGIGTLLFEDNWPTKGDYDFNDFVVQYKLKTWGNKHGASDVDVWLRLAALGGERPFRLCLMLDGVPTDDFIDFGYGDKEEDGVKVISKGKEDLALSIEWNPLKGIYGDRFYNTESAVPAEVFKEQVLNFTIRTKGKKKIDNNTFNFYIEDLEANKEIHLMGYKPTSSYAARYEEIVKENISTLNPDTYYKRTDGFVWGLKIPFAIAHAREEVNFCQAYTYFGEWVQSGGEKYTNWHEYGNSDKLIPLIK